MLTKNLKGKIPDRFLEILEKNIKELNPVQEKAVKAGLLDLESSFVIASPTASGKTLLSELMMIKAILEKKCKAIYIVPLKALANEKYNSFKKKYEPLGIKVAISTGDMDSSDSWLANYDLIILTSEKTDSLLRHKTLWMANVGVAVIDECHLINDPGRGPTLEVTITKLMRINPKILLLFLSATIKNSFDLANWINAKLVKSDYRPVKLHEGVSNGEHVEFLEKEGFELKGKDTQENILAADTVKMKKQALIFASTRRNAESIAEKTGVPVSKLLSGDELTELQKISLKAEKALASPTKQCKRLAKCIRTGTAFHHAGLIQKQRTLVEDAFKQGFIKIIASTPTLAAGINLPAYRCIIRDAKRYYSGYGFTYIPVLEYEQMRGRAGRPKFDKEGESILIAQNERQADELFEKFILGDTEEIYSKLASEPILRMHTLALIATGLVKTKKDIFEFFSSTFYGHQFPDEYTIEERLGNILKELIDWRFILPLGKEIRPTMIGKRVSELYIDPETAHNFLFSIDNYKTNEFGLLHLISSARELFPQLRVYQRESEKFESMLSENEQNILQPIPEEWDVDFETFMNAFKTALLFQDWISEEGEDILNIKFKVTPGELYSKLKICDWLLYACNELAMLAGRKESLSPIRKLRLRMKYGVREELLPLVKLKGIGRVRSRQLVRNGIRSISILKKTPPPVLEKLLGKKTAKDVLEQVGIKTE
ncbi:MAG: DEAD/DEAH box helicase [Candidatus Aenigmarchaeota archaeon]|nr:DEAD/DEAH box helicase [Candidatus Aenigmarchaeota archaeon]